MTPILIDISRLLYRRLAGAHPTGIDRVGIEYARHYGTRARAVLCWGPFSALLSQAESRRAFYALAHPEVPLKWFAFCMIAKACVTYWIPFNVRGQFLFNTSHTGLENRHYAWLMRRLGARPIIVIHDLIPLEHPEYCRAGEYERHRTRMHCALNIAHGIVVNSAHTLRALEDFCQQENQTLPPTVAALLATALPDETPAMHAAARPDVRPIEGAYFVMVSTIEPRKNHWMLLQIWRRLIQKIGADVPKLMVIGKRGWECENVVDLLERCIPLKGIVIEKKSCSDAELITYMRHAQALLFPSFAEGFGLPLCEALTTGLPVIASNLEVFREIADDVPDYADPLDGKRWEELITDYAKPDSTARAAQLARMQAFTQTTWSQHFAKVDAMLEKLA